jgi:tRNA-splicing ligase RtcB
MGAFRTSLRRDDLPADLSELRAKIESVIPTGFNQHEHPLKFDIHGKGSLGSMVQEVLEGFENLYAGVQEKKNKMACQIGTLGGGNHFIEVTLDEEGFVWLLLHSGSRHTGLQIAEFYIRSARGLPHNSSLPDKDLSALLAGSKEFEGYVADIAWASKYAAVNRLAMMELLQGVFQEVSKETKYSDKIWCHHNFVALEDHFGEKVFVTRKGAISADVGQLGLIPGSMGTKSYIVRGLGNPESFKSAAHGAGRAMSRSQAKKKFTLEDLARETEGVECRKDKGILDELPSAYKSIEVGMARQADLVEKVHELKQILCVKG